MISAHGRHAMWVDMAFCIAVYDSLRIVPGGIEFPWAESVPEWSEGGLYPW